jgi:carbon storage regulator CsrA
MLVISRRKGEKFTIFPSDGTEKTEVILIDVIGGKVRLGIIAPKSVRVFRNELLEGEGNAIGSQAGTD